MMARRMLCQNSENRSWLRAAMMAACLCLTMLFCSCARPAADMDRIPVAVTLLPEAEFVEAVGGDRVEAVVMVPPGASPHTYEPTPNQMVDLSRARMYAMIGTPVEFELVWLDKLVAANDRMRLVDCSRGIRLIATEGLRGHGVDQIGKVSDHHGDAGVDPHIWLSVKNAEVMVQNICEGLIEVDAEYAEYYRANCNRYLDELNHLDEELSRLLRPLEGKPFIVFHPAFGYFARDYGLIQVAVEQRGSEPDAQYIVRLVDAARDNNIKVVFVAPQVSTRSAEVIAREINGTVVVIDPLAKDYISNMKTIAEAMLRVSPET